MKFSRLDAFIVAAVVILFLLVRSYGQTISRVTGPDHKPAPYACVAGPDEKCASDLWFSDYTKLMALVKKYTPPQEIQDEMAGMRLRLSQQIPAGYGWDDGKKRFVKLPAPPPTPTPEKK
jgi:hypothetical protein